MTMVNTLMNNLTCNPRHHIRNNNPKKHTLILPSHYPLSLSPLILPSHFLQSQHQSPLCIPCTGQQQWGSCRTQYPVSTASRTSQYWSTCWSTCGYAYDYLCVHMACAHVCEHASGANRHVFTLTNTQDTLHPSPKPRHPPQTPHQLHDQHMEHESVFPQTQAVSTRACPGLTTHKSGEHRCGF